MSEYTCGCEVAAHCPARTGSNWLKFELPAWILYLILGPHFGSRFRETELGILQANRISETREHLKGVYSDWCVYQKRLFVPRDSHRIRVLKNLTAATGLRILWLSDCGRCPSDSLWIKAYPATWMLMGWLIPSNSFGAEAYCRAVLRIGEWHTSNVVFKWEWRFWRLCRKRLSLNPNFVWFT